MAKILLVEDDNDFALGIRNWLEDERHTVELVQSCEAGKYYATTFNYDLLILDWELPDGAGADLCKSLRLSGIRTPIAMLTARGAVNDRIEGLDRGADDYIPKPCPAEELSARIRALLRRQHEQSGNRLEIGAIVLDSSARSVTSDGVPVKLSPREFEILHLLMRNPEAVLSIEAIIMRLPQDDRPGPTAGAVKVYVSSLNGKFTAAGIPAPVKFRDGGYVFLS
jgi:DNA-binding response OmpR family regulator